MQNVMKICQKVQDIGPVSLLLEFEPQLNLDQSQMSFDNLIGYILSISMWMQNFITIFLTVQEIGPFFTFSKFGAQQSLDRKKMSVRNLIATPVHPVNINVYAKFHHNIPLSSRDRAIFTFFRIWHSAKTNVILQFPGLDLFNVKLSAKFYQTILNGLRVKFHFFSEIEPRQNLDQSQMSFDKLMGYVLSIPMCMQNFITIFHSKEIGPFSLFQNLKLGKTSTDEK